MKNICLLMILQIAVFAGYAQKNEPVKVQRPEPVNPTIDRQEFQGYTIILMPAMPTPESMGSYCFDISKDNKPVVHQFQNSYPFRPKAFARWMIREYGKTGHWQNMVPLHLARELKFENSY